MGAAPTVNVGISEPTAPNVYQLPWGPSTQVRIFLVAMLGLGRLVEMDRRPVNIAGDLTVTVLYGKRESLLERAHRVGGGLINVFFA